MFSKNICIATEITKDYMHSSYVYVRHVSYFQFSKLVINEPVNVNPHSPQLGALGLICFANNLPIRRQNVANHLLIPCLSLVGGAGIYIDWCIMLQQAKNTPKCVFRSVFRSVFRILQSVCVCKLPFVVVEPLY